MTIQALFFLHQLKRVQMSETGVIWIDEDSKKMVTVAERGAPQKTCNLSRKWQTVDSMAQYLNAEGILEYNRALNYIHLNFKGYHYIQAVIGDFLLKSVAVPILVAIATTLITLWLQGFF